MSNGDKCQPQQQIEKYQSLIDKTDFTIPANRRWKCFFYQQLDYWRYRLRASKQSPPLTSRDE